MRVFGLSGLVFLVVNMRQTSYFSALAVAVVHAVVILSAILQVPSAQAEIVPDLYAAEVTVSDRSADALEEGAKEALSVVLVKVSGSSVVLQSSQVGAAMQRARSKVQKYAYLPVAESVEGQPVRIEFGADFVTDLVRRSGAALWTANRPPVLVWVVVEDADGRHLFSLDRYPEMAQQLRSSFTGRGVVLQLPLFDLMDATAVSANDLWGRNEAVVTAASKRYGVNDIAIARVRLADANKVSGDWVYFFSNERKASSSIAESMRQFWRSGADLVADSMAARYAVAPSTAEVVPVYMTISGVFEYADYAGIVSWLDSLEPIAYAHLERVQGDTLTVRLGSRAQAQSLSAIIELNSHLVPVQSPEYSRDLSYRWQN